MLLHSAYILSFLSMADKPILNISHVLSERLKRDDYYLQNLTKECLTQDMYSTIVQPQKETVRSQTFVDGRNMNLSEGDQYYTNFLPGLLLMGCAKVNCTTIIRSPRL